MRSPFISNIQQAIALWKRPTVGDRIEAQYFITDTAKMGMLSGSQVMNIYELLQAKRESILQTASKYGAYNVRIFGSVARGEADSSSDVDFLVEMEPGRSLFDLGGLLMDLQELLDCNVDVVTEQGLRSRIRERVLKEAISL